MTYGVSGAKPLTKNEKRIAAREKAQLHRQEQKKKERRNRYLLQGGVTLGVLAIVGAIVFGVISSIPKTNAGPLNMLSDGIRIGADFAAEPTAAIQAGKEPVASVPSDNPDVVDIVVYLDYFCPACGAFEATNNEQIATWVKSGAALLEIHPVAILDRASLGTKYSTRAANAAACVANYSPDTFFEFNGLMFENQPEEGTEGLTDEQIIDIAKQAKVSSQSKIASCINDVTFKTWVNAATARAFEGPLPNANIDRVKTTPTVIVNGLQYTGSITDASEFAKFVSTANANAVTDEQKATPSPSPSPSA